jgi:hypothetical protein
VLVSNLLNEASKRQKELIELIIVVVMIGLISNIVASYLATFTFFGISVGVVMIPVLFVLISISVYLILFPRETTKSAIYTNILVDRSKNRLHLSPFSPFAVQHAVLLWEALQTDDPKLASELILKPHNTDSDKFDFDFAEYVILLSFSSFEPFWAASRIEYYGYPTFLHKLGEESRYSPSTLYRIQNQETEYADIIGLKNVQCKNLKPILKDNFYVEHFLGKTSLNWVYKPDNWMIFTPKGTQISINSNKFSREICFKLVRFHHELFSITLSIRKNSVSRGLPLGISTKEKNYSDVQFFTTDYRIDYQATFSPILLLYWKRDDYYNWAQLIKQKIAANFALDKTPFIKDVQ